MGAKISQSDRRDLPSILSGEEISPLIQKVIRADSGEQKQPAGYDVSVNMYPFLSQEQV